MTDAQQPNEPIAVVGLSCRFPGGDGPDAFWELIRHGGDAVTDVPRERTGPGALARRGGFLADLDRFDADFFGVPAAEADRLDPQQRLVLETAWAALEDAGFDTAALAGSRTGVFVGLHSQSSDYYWMQAANPNAYTGTGTSHNMVAGRLAYLLDLRGPALAVDTACSSALVAVHLAIGSLRSGESDVALVGGVNLALTDLFAGVGTQMGLLSPSGACRPFDAGADGIVSGEGCGVLVLKPLSAAERDGDRIHGVLLGSAVGQDGHSNGLTAPNPLAQVAVVREALGNAGLTPDRVSYVEAHGTGTLLGDPIELEALADVFAPGPLPALGSVKANIGHLEGAAGIAALIKVLLMLRHSVIPPQAHFSRPNPNIDAPGYPHCVPSAPRDWDRAEHPRTAGVSAFGWSGTNAHVIVGEPPAAPPATPAEGPLLLTGSTASEAALRELAAVYAAALPSAASAADFAFTANTGRTALPHRFALAAEPGELAGQLAAFATGASAPAVHQGRAARRPKVAFLFTGQGDHYVGMGRELLRTAPVFAAELRRCAEVAARWSEPGAVESVIDGTCREELLDDPVIAQLALACLQIALAAHWQDLGIRPTAVLGHSLGEYAAAHVAGVLGLEHALLLVAERARLMRELPTGGGMTAVHTGPEETAELIAGLTDHLGVGAYNAPRTTVVSGAVTALETLEAGLTERGIRFRRLAVPYAFHSRLVEPVLPGFTAATARVEYGRPSIPMVAAATGQLLRRADLDEGYWARQIREPVRFTDGMARLLERNCTTFVEIGPRGTLVGMGRSSAPDDDLHWIPSLRPGRPEQHLEALGRLFCAGAGINWTAAYRDSAAHRVELPGYPFQRTSHWLTDPTTPAALPPAAPPARPEPGAYALAWRPA
ncbi:type I polyketide synthase, partial [Streptomyces sp. W16]|uniref:type I polyketide synthase n=1 Tax=Streptomyces sp. W16 TaxID=3076631 RepID=UPI00295A6DB8